MTRLRLPISVRLTLWYGLSMVFLLGLFLVLMVTSFHWSQHLLLHQRLFQAQSELVPHVQFVDGVPQLSPPLSARSEAFRQAGNFGMYVRVLSPTGSIWDQTPNFAGAAPLTPVVPEQEALTEIEHHWQGAAVRSMYVPLMDGETLVGWLEASAFAWDIHQHVPGASLLLSILLTVLVALGGGYVLARRALRPVARLTQAADALTASDLSIRLPMPDRLRDELTDLAATFNTMLERLETAFNRERRFTANAAHELLNPLAAIRNEAEVGLRQERTPAAYQQALAAIREDATRLGTMVEQLLLIARLDTEAAPAAEPVNLGALCEERAQMWQRRAEKHNLHLTLSTEADVTLIAYADHLGTALDNLLDNAVKYTPPGGSVTIFVRKTPDEAVLEVRDTGIGFDADTAPHLFNRFYRPDTPEVQAQAGSGLGLAIVQTIVQTYGGTVTAHSDGPGQGSVFTMRFPKVDV